MEAENCPADCEHETFHYCSASGTHCDKHCVCSCAPCRQEKPSVSREIIAKKIHWPWIIWTMGIINVGAMLPQLYKLITTHQTEGLALTMFWLYFAIQTAFSLEGYFTRNRMLMVCLGLSAIVSAMIIGTVLYLRHFAA